MTNWLGAEDVHVEVSWAGEVTAWYGVEDECVEVS